MNGLEELTRAVGGMLSYQWVDQQRIREDGLKDFFERNQKVPDFEAFDKAPNLQEQTQLICLYNKKLLSTYYYDRKSAIATNYMEQMIKAETPFTLLNAALDGSSQPLPNAFTYVKGIPSLDTIDELFARKYSNIFTNQQFLTTAFGGTVSLVYVEGKRYRGTQFKSDFFRKFELDGDLINTLHRFKGYQISIYTREHSIDKLQSDLRLKGQFFVVKQKNFDHVRRYLSFRRLVEEVKEILIESDNRLSGPTLRTEDLRMYDSVDGTVPLIQPPLLYAPLTKPF